VPPHLNVPLLGAELIRTLFGFTSPTNGVKPFMQVQVFQQCLRLLQVRWVACCAPLSVDAARSSVMPLSSLGNQDDTLKTWEALLRIATTPTPFVYRHLLAVMLFTFIFTYAPAQRPCSLEHLTCATRASCLRWLSDAGVCLRSTDFHSHTYRHWVPLSFLRAF
jgi:hypothetical protein